MSQRFWLILATLLLLIPAQAQAFCGFFVAGAGAELYNSRSEVVMVRDGQQTTLTLQFNYKGNPNQFALVLPVPVVLQKEDVKVSRRELFKRLDTYTAPRLVDYPAEDPCSPKKTMRTTGVLLGAAGGKGANKDNEKVKVEAAFSVEEYDIVVLSAKESNALETWLKQNEFVIPEGGAPYYTPYIEKGMFFFVVKVNLEKLQNIEKVTSEDGYQMLRPLQFTFESEGWMLPIQLGKINAEDEQHLILYVLSPDGRAKVANYNNADIPTNLYLDNTYKQDPKGFAQLYKAMLEKVWSQQTQETVLTEYYWSASSCDPCPTDPPSSAELQELGFPAGKSAYITRLHAAYKKDTYMQDLTFENAGATHQGAFFQGRYIMHFPFDGETACLDENARIEGVRRGQLTAKTDKEKTALAEARKDPKIYLDAYLGAPTKPTASAGGAASDYIELGVASACTEEECPPDNACCHSCSFEGWVLSSNPMLKVDFSSAPKPPECQMDGCGRCQTILEVKGEEKDGVFVVSQWRQGGASAGAAKTGAEANKATAKTPEGGGQGATPEPEAGAGQGGGGSSPPASEEGGGGCQAVPNPEVPAAPLGLLLMAGMVVGRLRRRP